jgi:hypothetical protein
VKISGSVEEGSPPGSDPSGAAPGKKAACPDSMEKKSPRFLHFGARYGIFYTGKPFRVGKHFVTFAALA